MPFQKYRTTSQVDGCMDHAGRWDPGDYPKRSTIDLVALKAENMEEAFSLQKIRWAQNLDPIASRLTAEALTIPPATIAVLKRPTIPGVRTTGRMLNIRN
jgi:hypothetical protein